MAALGLRLDPFPAFNFIVALVDNSSTLAGLKSSVNLLVGGGFSDCSGLEGTLQVEDYNEGGENRFVHKLPTRMSYSNIVLKRGVGFNEELWNWHFQYITGKGKRRDGVILLQNELRIPVKVWVFRRGLPLKWTGPTLNAAQNAVAIESLEIVHQGLELASVGVGLERAGEFLTTGR